jgi:hypothetical protein
MKAFEDDSILSFRPTDVTAACLDWPISRKHAPGRTAAYLYLEFLQAWDHWTDSVQDLEKVETNHHATIDDR